MKLYAKRVKGSCLYWKHMPRAVSQMLPNTLCTSSRSSVLNDTQKIHQSNISTRTYMYKLKKKLELWGVRLPPGIFFTREDLLT